MELSPIDVVYATCHPPFYSAAFLIKSRVLSNMEKAVRLFVGVKIKRHRLGLGKSVNSAVTVKPFQSFPQRPTDACNFQQRTKDFPNLLLFFPATFNFNTAATLGLLTVAT